MSLRPMAKCVELQKACFKTATFYFLPMAKFVEFTFKTKILSTMKIGATNMFFL
jgi:hypothetical protein